MKKKRKRFSPEQKAGLVRRHLVDGVSVAGIAEEAGFAPGQFYGWQQQVFSNLPTLFDRQSDSAEQQREQEIEQLRRTIARKDEVIVEVTAS